MKNEHAANRDNWDHWAECWHRDSAMLLQQSVERPQSAFLAPAFEILHREYPDARGVDACVLGSGDNRCAFALSAMGFQTTSVDISGQQLRIASEHADRLALRIRFIQSDAIELPEHLNDQFDLVLTSNGFFVWMSDLDALFGSAFRILRPRGRMISYDVHPFQRPWDDRTEPLTMLKTYWDKKPLQAKSSEQVFEYHWTLSDIVNCSAGAGFHIRRMVESPSEDDRFWRSDATEGTSTPDCADWRRNPKAGLPVWLVLLLSKPSAVGA